MSLKIENSGDIETICETDPVQPGVEVKLFFRSQDEDETEPPFNLKIKSPSGRVIVERVLRELPTGKPLSTPPIAFTVSASGDYTVEINMLYGKLRGNAVLHVTY